MNWKQKFRNWVDGVNKLSTPRTEIVGIFNYQQPPLPKELKIVIDLLHQVEQWNNAGEQEIRNANIDLAILQLESLKRKNIPETK